MSITNFELLLRFPLDAFSFNPERKAGLEIRSNDKRRTFSIYPKRPDEDGFGYRLGVECRITADVPCDAEQHQFISEFLAGRLQRREGGAKPPLLSHGEMAVDQNGQIQDGVAFWFDWMPTDIQALVDNALDCIWNELDRIFRILRWEQKSSFRIPDRSVAAVPYWRVSTDALFYPVPQRSESKRAHPDRETGWFGWAETEQASFLRLWANQAVDEPLGHELQNEAELLVERAPRSALLMATAAVEVGVKDHIGRVAPPTEWLLREVPSPPVAKLLKKYIPLLHSGNPNIVIWNKLKGLFNIVENDIVPARNKLSHTGARIKADDVRAYVKLTRDILYLLDYLEGHEWALDNLSWDTRKLAGMPLAPEHKRDIEIVLHLGPDIRS